MAQIFQVSCGSRHDWNFLYSDAHSKLEQGDFSSALKETDLGFSESSGRDPVWNWKFRVLKAEIFQWQTRSADILELLHADPPAELSSGEFAVRAIAAVGMAHANLHNDAEGTSQLKEAEDLASRTAPQLLCQVLVYQGNQAFKMTNYALAEQRYHDALQSARQHHEPFFESGAAIGLGITLTRLSRYDEAIQASLDSLALANSRQYHVVENIATANLAWSYEELGDLEKALYYFSQQEKVLDHLGNDQLKVAVLSNMGEVYYYGGKYVEAKASYLRALGIAEEMDRKKGTDQRSYIAVILSHLVEIALEEGKTDESKGYSRDAAGRAPNNPNVLLASARIEIVTGQLAEARKLLQSISDIEGKDNLVRWDIEAELANISVAEHQNSRAEAEFARLIGEVEIARSKLHVDENRFAFSFHADRYYDDFVRFLVATGQQQKAFQVAEFSRARVLEEAVGMKALAHPSDVNISAVQDFLRQHKRIVLAYWLARNESFLWLISASHFETFTLASGLKIEREVQTYNKILTNSGTTEDLEQSGQTLYRLLIAPAEKLIPHDGKVVIVPDGGLDRLNFETVRVPQPVPHYWIEDVETQVATSTALLVRSKRAVWSRVSNLLLIGDPVPAGSEYGPLAHAGEEIRRISAHFLKHETAISGKDATPSAYGNSHPERYSLVHFVAHASASELSPLESALILSPEGENSFKLYAREIVKIHLDADLVTISACGGAGKRAYAGEGLVGLAWAFLKAGAHRVVAGLWEVDDLAAVDLTDTFYTELQKRNSASEALRFAKLKMVRSTGIYRLPYYWAPLQLYMGS